MRRRGVTANLHPYPYSSKFPPLTLQCAEKVSAPLPENPGNGAGVGSEFQFAVPGIDHVNPHGERSRQVPANGNSQCLFAIAPRFPFGKGRVRGENVFERRHRDGGGE